MNGLLVIDKLDGMTSHDVVARVRRILKTKRVGHTGTLDPFATGVLVVLVGKATRLAQFLEKDEKEYEATVQFGFETDTGDRTGSPTSKVQSPKLISFTELGIDLKDFRGEIEQLPPMYSAKKVKGKKLYELARKGITTDREPVKVTIHELEIIDDNEIRDPNGQIRIRIICSAGTYIRTLAEDIGRRLGAGAHLAELRRTRAGKFGLEQSLLIADLEMSDKPAAGLINVEEAVSHLPDMMLSADRIEKTLNGLSTRVDYGQFQNDAAVRMTDKTGKLIAVGFYNVEENSVRPKIVLS